MKGQYYIISLSSKANPNLEETVLLPAQTNLSQFMQSHLHAEICLGVFEWWLGFTKWQSNFIKSSDLVLLSNL